LIRRTPLKSFGQLQTFIHVIDGYMQKIQILFPDPTMAQLRRLARLQDRPVSEIIRRAVEESLARSPEPNKTQRRIPSFRGGKILCSAEDLRETLYREDLR
jgi:phage gpG-like protein